MKIFEFTSGDIIYKLKMAYKFCIIYDDSGTGKSALVRTIANLNRSGDKRYLALYNTLNVEVIVPDVCELVVIDEEYLRNVLLITKLKDFLDKHYYVLLISRHPLKELNYNYKQIFKFTYSNNTTELEPVYRTYNYLSKDPDYIEDFKSGYKYYKQFFHNVQSTKGRNNIKNIATKGSTVIADGCSIGHEMPSLVAYYDLFLPESFEWLILRFLNKVPKNINLYNVEKTYVEILHSLTGYTKRTNPTKMYNRCVIQDFEISNDVITDYLVKYSCGASVQNIRDIIENLPHMSDTDLLIKTALVLYTLNK